jgi:hypothetical protein
MAEKHYVFIKNNKPVNSAVFANKDDILAQQIVDEKGYDSFVWLNELPIPNQDSTWNETTFVSPTIEELTELGVIFQGEVLPPPTE